MNVMQGFRERIASREWLDEETKERAIRKVSLNNSLEAACYVSMLEIYTTSCNVLGILLVETNRL